MRQIVLLLLLLASIGCRETAQSLIEDGIHGACGESSNERRDRHTLEANRDSWSTPGRSPYEVETEARGTFRRANGREPNLNWSAR